MRVSSVKTILLPYSENNFYNTEVQTVNVMLLLLRFCVYFSLQTLKKMINIWSLLKKFFALPDCVGLATALFKDERAKMF